MMETEKKLQTMDVVLKFSTREIVVLEEDKQQLSAALDTSQAGLDAAVEATQEEGCNEATASYEEQFIKLENKLFEDGWMAAFRATKVPKGSKLMKNIPYPQPEALEKPGEKAIGGANKEDPLVAK